MLTIIVFKYTGIIRYIHDLEYININIIYEELQVVTIFIYDVKILICWRIKKIFSLFDVHDTYYIDLTYRWMDIF